MELAEHQRATEPPTSRTTEARFNRYRPGVVLIASAGQGEQRAGVHRDSRHFFRDGLP